ncbi:uncharacterized protein GGS22DRAFT_158010 [Annulohypoxylon maeteangense]|uniref:uncharacterized protein n=1 Tax=Annulohypoxylon maeteangense TaxID=1927788 RepID=UPI002007B60A|nr:uncharacterized protein GGS22DRAFT_158010 [Annulohypoxylon maeteangense]KAI0886503.1 hypothetical protein GGS22DRAFT_158010 [Annulohypoxylon maeteangense]
MFEPSIRRASQTPARTRGGQQNSKKTLILSPARTSTSVSVPPGVVDHLHLGTRSSSVSARRSSTSRSALSLAAALSTLSKPILPARTIHIQSQRAQLRQHLRRLARHLLALLCHFVNLQALQITRHVRLVALQLRADHPRLQRAALGLCGGDQGCEAVVHAWVQRARLVCGGRCGWVHVRRGRVRVRVRLEVAAGRSLVRVMGGWRLLLARRGKVLDAVGLLACGGSLLLHAGVVDLLLASVV